MNGGFSEGSGKNDVSVHLRLPRTSRSVDINEIQIKDQKITTCFHWYNRSRDEKTVLYFLRFVTGSSAVIPNERIKFSYMAKLAEHVHPVSPTFFRALNLLRQYLW